MSRTFLQLCQNVVTDTGVAGSQIALTVGNTSNELSRIVGWVAAADILIQNVWSDWNFLWSMDAITIPANVDSFMASKLFNDIDRKSLVLNPDTSASGPSFPKWMDWQAFYFQWQCRTKTINATPTNWAVDPSGKIWLSHLTAGAVTAQLQYWLQPTRLVQPTDVSPIPTQYDRIIVERAKILYAQRENAPEILSGSSAEYIDALDKLESAYLPSGRAARKSRNDATTNPDGYVE